MRTTVVLMRFLVIALVAGCVEGKPPDSSADTVDSAPDTVDTAAETGADTSVDTAADTSVDTAADTAPDTSVDTDRNPNPIHLVFVVDITGSWTRVNLANMRAGLVAALDVAAARGEAGDTVALVTFHGRYAEAFTPWTDLGDAAAVDELRTAWGAIETISRGGVARPYPEECMVFADSPRGAESAQNQYTAPSPEGGCYPNMPREYTDEAGTDHTTGITLASQLFDEAPAHGRVMILVTDGIPNGIVSGHGQYRVDQGYAEARWREYQGVVPHTTADIKTDSVALSAAMYADQGVESWVVSFVQHDAFLDAVATGRGTTQLVEESEDFVGVLPGILEDLSGAAE